MSTMAHPSGTTATAPVRRRSDPTTENIGFLLLVAAYVTLLAGDFSLLGFQLRFLALPGLVIAASTWIQVASPPTRPLRLGTPLVLLSFYVVWVMASGEWAGPDAPVAKARYDLLSLTAAMGLTNEIGRRLSADTISRLWHWIFATGLIYFALGLVSPNSAQGRWQAPGGGPNVFVRAMALGILAAIFLTIAKRSSLWLLGLPLFAAGALFSGSRGGVASLGFVALLSLIPLSRKIGVRRIASLILRSVVACAVLVAIVPGDSISRISRRFIDSVFVQRYTSGRDDIAEQALQVATDNIWIGAGLNEIQGRVGTHAHNLFLTAASEAGLIGLVLLSSAIISFALRIRAVRPLSLAGFYYAVASGLILTMSMFSGYYYDTRFAWFFLLLAFFSSQSDAGTPPAKIREKSAESPGKTR